MPSVEAHTVNSRTRAPRGRRRSRSAPPRTVAPMTAPMNHMPWEHAHTHARGTSHHRGWPSSADRSHASTKTTHNANVTRCGRGVRLPDMASSVIPRVNPVISPIERRRQAPQTQRPTPTTPVAYNQETAEVPPNCSAQPMSSSGSHSCRTHVLLELRLHGSGPTNCQVWVSHCPVRMCQKASGSLIGNRTLIAPMTARARAPSSPRAHQGKEGSRVARGASSASTMARVWDMPGRHVTVPAPVAPPAAAGWSPQGKECALILHKPLCPAPRPCQDRSTWPTP